MKIVFLDVFSQSVIRYAKSVHFNKTNKKGGIAMKYLTEQLPLFETLHIKDLMTALESLIHK